MTEIDHLSFKKTIIYSIPKEWELVRLGDSLNLIRNGLITSQNKDGKGIPITRIETISYEKVDAQRVGYVEKISERELSEYKLQDGDILFSHINSLEHIGKTAIYDSNPPVLLHGMNLLLLRPKKSIVDPYYLLFRLKHLRAKSVFRNLSKKAVNQASINQTELSKIQLPLPPLPEQKKIAEILSTVDQAIEKVNQAIKKTQRLKNGLMQGLFTGRWQTANSRQGKREFKNTEIGRIPKEWVVTQLKDAVEINRDSGDPAKEFPNEKILYIDIDSVENETGVITKAKEILGKDAPSRARRVIHYNDVLMSTVRPYLKAFAIVPKKYHRQICSTGFAVLTCRENIYSQFLLYALFTGSVINQCNRMMVGGQYPALNTSQVERIKIPIPPVSEQQKIAEILSTVDDRLELLRKRKEKLEMVKKGLMDDLLTGKVRVTRLIEGEG